MKTKQVFIYQRRIKTHKPFSGYQENGKIIKEKIKIDLQGGE